MSKAVCGAARRVEDYFSAKLYRVALSISLNPFRTLVVCELTHGFHELGSGLARTRSEGMEVSLLSSVSAAYLYAAKDYDEGSAASSLAEARNVTLTGLVLEAGPKPKNSI